MAVLNENLINTQHNIKVRPGVFFVPQSMSFRVWTPCCVILILPIRSHNLFMASLHELENERYVPLYSLKFEFQYGLPGKRKIFNFEYES